MSEQRMTIEELAHALYEGTQRLHNLAEHLAQQHGKAEALTFFSMMGDDVQNFWRGIAKQLIDHAKEWQENNGCACVLSASENERLRNLPRVPVHPEGAETGNHVWKRHEPSKHWWCEACEICGGKADKPADVGPCPGVAPARDGCSVEGAKP